MTIRRTRVMGYLDLHRDTIMKALESGEKMGDIARRLSVSPSSFSRWVKGSGFIKPIDTLKDDFELIQTLRTSGMTCNELAQKWEVKPGTMKHFIEKYCDPISVDITPGTVTMNRLFRNPDIAAETDEPVTVVYHGKPSFVVVPIDLYEEMTHGANERKSDQ